jgi:hypothetical protein
MIYEGWQINNTVSLSENVRQAIAMYVRKHGEPPNILETPLKDMPLPEGMNMVTRWINLPKNILLIGKVE